MSVRSTVGSTYRLVPKRGEMDFVTTVVELEEVGTSVRHGGHKNKP